VKWVVRGVGAVLLLGAIAAAVAAGVGRAGVEAWLARVPVLERFYSRVVPPPTITSVPAVSATDPLTAEERRAFRELARQTGGRFIWSSNRGGNHDLYVIDLATLDVRRLTHDPHVDYFARFSPDGRRIVFTRSQRPWVSFRETDAWDLYVMNADGSDGRRLAVEAYHPDWTPDGSEVTFLRDNVIVGINPATGVERQIFDGSSAPTRGEIGDPAIGPDGLVCMSLRGGEAPRGVGVLDLAGRTYRGLSGRSACHSTWLPGSRTVIWVDANGQGGTRVMHADAVEGTEATLIDLPGPFSHEYFPKVSADRRWLVWGAAASGHEHDRADYEMFAWRLGTGWESAIRLTHSPSNDQWPDLYNRPPEPR
jgi:hypothetical protein